MSCKERLERFHKILNGYIKNGDSKSLQRRLDNPRGRSDDDIRKYHDQRMKEYERHNITGISSQPRKKGLMKLLIPKGKTFFSF